MAQLLAKHIVGALDSDAMDVKPYTTHLSIDFIAYLFPYQLIRNSEHNNRLIMLPYGA